MTRMVAILTLTIGLGALGRVTSATPPSQSTSTLAPGSTASAIPQALIGRWVAMPERIPLSEGSGWGPSAASVRHVDLRLTTDGTGTLTVTRLVTNRTGAPLAGSRIVERIVFALGAVSQSVGLRRRYGTSITSATRRYPEPPVVDTTMGNVRLDMFPVDADPDALDIAVEVFSGDGSFAASLRRQRTARTS